MLTIRLTTVSSLRLVSVYRRLRTRAVWRGFLLGMFALVGFSLALHFTLHTFSDTNDDNDSHQCPASHINVVHSGIRITQPISDRVAPNAACQSAIAFDGAMPRYFDEAPMRALVSAEYTAILSARGPPARL